MVFLTRLLLATEKSKRVPHHDRFWRKHKVLRMSAHFYGRRRNCVTIAARGVIRALKFATEGRAVRRADLKRVWQCRIMAACEENGISYSAFRDGLASSEIYLNTKVLADIACYEPKTFKSLATLAWSQAKNDGINVLDKFSDPPPGVFTRGMLK